LLLSCMFFFFSYLTNFSYFPLNFFPKNYRMYSDQVKNWPLKRGCRCFQLFFIDFQLFYFRLAPIINCKKKSIKLFSFQIILHILRLFQHVQCNSMHKNLLLNCTFIEQNSTIFEREKLYKQKLQDVFRSGQKLTFKKRVQMFSAIFHWFPVILFSILESSLYNNEAFL
jgi:hypothetical protein